MQRGALLLCSLLAANSQFSVLIRQKMQLTGWDNGNYMRNATQPRTQGIRSWGAKYPGMAWSRDPRILCKMAYCLLGSGE